MSQQQCHVSENKTTGQIIITVRVTPPPGTAYVDAMAAAYEICQGISDKLDGIDPHEAKKDYLRNIIRMYRDNLAARVAVLEQVMGIKPVPLPIEPHPNDENGH